MTRGSSAVSPFGWAILVTLAMACSRDHTTTKAASATLGAPARASEARTICEDCIQFRRLVILGDSTGPGYVVSTDNAVRDSLGRYWLGQYRDMIKVFDSTGHFMRTVGRQGKGPMEFEMPAVETTDGAGRVHVVDADIGRETVIGPDFRLYTTHRLPASMWHFAPLANGRGYIGNGLGSTPDDLALPLHIMRVSGDPQVVRSFGRSESDVTSLTPKMLFRVIATNSSGRIYSMARGGGKINVWTSDGHLLRQISEPELAGGEPQEGPSNLPRSFIQALRAESSSRLWVLVALRRPDWREHMREVPGPGGRDQLVPMDDDFSALFSSRIDVIELTTDSVIARTERDEFFESFLGNGLILENRMTQSGIPQVAIWKVEWQTAPER